MAGPCAKVNFVLSAEPSWTGMPADADANRRSLATLVPTKVALIQHDAMRNLIDRHHRIAHLLWRDTLIDAAIQSGIAARGGLHIGERMLTDDSDPVVQFSADMADAAVPGELYVSRTVADLLPGSGLRFEHRGQLAMPLTGNAITVLAVLG